MTPYRYLILHNGEAFYTHWFDHENLYCEGMIVFNLHLHQLTFDGITWKQITEDQL